MGDQSGSSAPQQWNPLTAVCVLADKQRCPSGFVPITKAFDDNQQEADIWKDGFFSLSRIIRYIAICREIPSNAFVLNVVADICVVNEREVVPSGFIPIEYTEDTREKALRKKQLCIRYVPRDTAIDAVCDLIILARQKKPPQGYSLAGEIDGLLLCYKYGIIPESFGIGRQRPALYPNIPHAPYSSSSTVKQQASVNGSSDDHHSGGGGYGEQQRQSSLDRMGSLDIAAGYMTMARQTSKGVDDIPFELNPVLKAAAGFAGLDALPELHKVDPLRLEKEFSYNFGLEISMLRNY